jgi:hypothetical protein
MYMLVAPTTPGSQAAAVQSLQTGMSGYTPDSVRARLMTFYPPPYGFASGLAKGVGDCGCGGKCGGCGHDHGMGQLFDSGTDISGWGWPEWAIVGGAAFAVMTAVSAVGNAGRKVSRSVRGVRSRAKKRAALKQQLGDTGWF